MRRAASILGILGGLGIFIPALLLLPKPYATMKGDYSLAILSLLPLAVAVTGVVGGARATAKPRSSGIMMLASGIVGLPFAFVYFLGFGLAFEFSLPSAVLFSGAPPLMLIVGGVLALRSR